MMMIYEKYIYKFYNAKKEKEKYFLKSIDKKLTTYYNNYCR